MDTQERFGKLVSHRLTGNSVHLRLECGAARIDGIMPGVIRLRVTPSAVLPEDRSFAIEKPPASAKLSVIKKGEDLLVKGRGITLLVHGRDFAVSLLDGKGALLSRGTPMHHCEKSVTDGRDLQDGEDFFGLGERISPLGRRGYVTVNWNYDNARYHNETDESMYISLPIMISLNAGTGQSYGYFLDSSYRTVFDLGHGNWRQARISAHTCELNVYFITGTGVREILGRYTDLTGRHPLPPMWALGYHQCRWGYEHLSEVKAVADNFRKRKIPCDTLWYDIDYMDEYRVFTFDRKRFGDIRKHLKETQEKGFRSVVIVDPGVKVDKKGNYDVYDEANAKRYFLRMPDGKDYIGKVWPGESKFPDFSRPEVREWWGRMHQRYFDEGVDGIWNDMNEIADFTDHATKTVPPETLMWDEGRWSMQDRMHNVYALLEAKATYEGMRKLKANERPFILTRAGYSGVQKYSAKWCGDNTSSWDHLRASIQQIINMGLSGVGFVGVDVGGFGWTNSNPELLTRWTQAGVFYPFFRNHTARSTISQEPWCFGKETEDICRDAISLRYHLLPYFYQLFHEMAEQGSPVMRPLFWGNEDDPRTNAVADQLLLGNYLMAAPVLERGARSRKVYFPKGEWYHYFTGEKFEGGREYLVEAPLDSIPMFIKAGSVVPATQTVESTAKLDKTRLILEVVAGKTSFHENYYEDDMISLEHEKGAFSLSPISLSARKLTFKPAAKSNIKRVAVRLFTPSFKNGLPEGFKTSGLWAEREFSGSVDIAL
jgi:alpha-glucosidase